jgi:hypothetical protein
MDAPVRSIALQRSQLLFGLYSQVRVPTRPAADDRVDLPEIEESTRVSFSEGVTAQAGFPVRSGVDRYRVLQADAEREGARRSIEDDKEL